jgi:hypothetical protein
VKIFERIKEKFFVFFCEIFVGKAKTSDFFGFRKTTIKRDKKD